MNKIRTIAILIAMMAISTAVFAQQTQTVTVLTPGANCPSKGIVKSQWLWTLGGNPNTHTLVDGTTASYIQVPQTVVVQAIYPPNNWAWFVDYVIVTVVPSGHPEASNSLPPIHSPFLPLGISPGTCDTDLHQKPGPGSLY